MKKLLIIGVLLLAFSQALLSQSIKIGILRAQKLNAITASVSEGIYLAIGDGDQLGEYKKGIFYITRQGHKVEVRDRKNLLGVFNEFHLQPAGPDAVLSVRGINPSTTNHFYDDALIISAESNRLLVINKVDMEKYIAGVIEAEGGPNAALEYYKAQAVLIRTYTIKKMFRHGEERFNLCDQVHCQAFHGRSHKNPMIYEATSATAGEVLVDQDSVLVMSPFHSNCGGTTCRSGQYWQKDLPYLQSIVDPFCTKSRNAHWTKEITLPDWNRFMLSQASLSQEELQQTHTYPNGKRSQYLKIGKYQISFRAMREHWGLKSAYFAIERRESTIVLIGKGYGHGIGMCQEGAMEMAKVGYPYKDIIFFYFQGVEMTDYREMDLHRY